MTVAAGSKRGGGRRRGAGRARMAALMVGAVAVEAVSLRLKSGRLGGEVIVRCREGHLFTTLWIPGASLKALRLGWSRFQRCPVGGHWSLVTPVAAGELTDDERAQAEQQHDVRIP